MQKEILIGDWCKRCDKACGLTKWSSGICNKCGASCYNFLQCSIAIDKIWNPLKFVWYKPSTWFLGYYTYTKHRSEFYYK